MKGIETAKRQRAALLLAEGHTTKATAAAVRVRPETLSRWKATPSFQALIAEALNRKARGDMEERLQALAPEALDLLTHALRLRDLDRNPDPRAIEAAGQILAAAILNPKPPARPGDASL
jgi:hypothetical protein